jgi:hypothetical protein
VPEFDYSQDWDPPAPVIEVQIASISTDQHEPILALLDTGADQSVIPPSVIQRLKMPQVDEMDVLVYQEGRRRQETVPVFQAHLDLGAALPSINLQCLEMTWEVGGADDPIPEHIIIGREILNLFSLVLEGQALHGTASFTKP